MDANTRPESIMGSACEALISTVQQVATNVTNFVRRCRSARTDLAPVTRELSELQMVLQLLNDFEAQSDAVPDELQLHLRPIITNCIGLVCKVQDVLQRQEVAGWTVEARDEVGELAKSLGVHRGVMGVVADLVSVLMSREEATGEQRVSNNDKDEHAQMRVLLKELQTLGSSLVISYSNATLAREHFALQVHLGQIATYTATLARMDDPTTDPWQDAVRTLDEAERMAGLDQQTTTAMPQKTTTTITTSAMQGSIARPASLRRGHSMDGNVAAAGVRNSGLENLLLLGPPEMCDGRRPPSVFLTPPKRVSGLKPPAEIESAGPLGTGFIVMDGFMNSAQAGTTTESVGLCYGDRQQPSIQHSSLLGSETSSDWRMSCESRSSRELSSAQLNAQRLKSIPPAVREGASGLEVQIPDEKELAADEGVSDEALAFAQVPIHALDRLSVNLMGQVYGGSPSPSTPPPQERNSAAGTQSHHSTKETSQERGEANTWDGSEAASYTTGDTSAHQNGRLENANQFNVAKTAASKASTFPMSHSHINPQPLSQPQTPLGQQDHHHQQPQPQPQQLLPASHLLSQFPSNSLTSQTASSQPAMDEITTTGIVPASPRPSFQQHSPLPSPHPHHHHLRSASNNSSFLSANYNSGLRETTSSSTIKTTNTQSYFMSTQKPLPRAPLVYIPDYPGPFIKKKVVVVGNFSCGKTCFLTRMSRGQYPRSKADEVRITETIKVSVDESPVQLCFWDIRGIDYDPSWLHGAHVALVCFSVNIGSTDSKGKHLGRWVAEVNRNCPGAAILLVGLKSDIRFHAKSVEKLARKGKALVTPEQGEQFRENIGATRYVECSARTGEGVQDVLAETARVALQVSGGGRAKHGRKSSSSGSARRPLSRIGKFFGFVTGDG